MGLFGYNEKDFKKNSEVFKNRLQMVMDSTYDRGVNNYGVGKALTQIIVAFDRLPYPKGGKEMQKIDEHISKIISDMEQDAMKKRMSSIVLRAENLYRELDESRRFGMNAFNDNERQAEGVRVDALGHIHDALNRKEVIEAKKQELIEKAAKSNEAQQQKYRLDYNTLDKEGKSLEQTITMWTSRYNSAVEVINARRTAGQIKELEETQVGNLKEFEKEMADATRRLEKQITIDNEFTGIAEETTSGFDSILGTASTGSSGFDAAVEDQRQKNLMDEMGGASGSGATGGSQVDDPFSQAMRNAGK